MTSYIPPGKWRAGRSKTRIAVHPLQHSAYAFFQVHLLPELTAESDLYGPIENAPPDQRQLYRL
jgi:hypothetical protein